MKVIHIILILIFFASGIFYYNLTGNATIDTKNAFVIRVIDGDTLETDIGKIRLLGINTPEKGMPDYNDAKEHIKNLVENKTIKIEISGTDKYGRILGHAFFGSIHINEEILEKGYGTLYYYEKDEHYQDLKNAEEYARLNKLGIWQESVNKNCLELVELKYVEDGERCSNGERIKIKNKCDKTMTVLLKDDATHIYDIKIEGREIYEQVFSCIWNDDGDSLYAWDDSGMVLFYRY